MSQTLEVLQSQQKLTGDKEYLFYTRSVKRYFSHDTLVASFKRLLARNKIKERVLYNLIHTFASQMISQGVDIVWVSKTLGHKDVSITLSTYTKFIKEDEATRFQKFKRLAQFLTHWLTTSCQSALI
ncbi:tyrosine-type recombinase/integrase [Arcobacter cryaerophilus gv. pseudocryaerophilus]